MKMLRIRVHENSAQSANPGGSDPPRFLHGTELVLGDLHGFGLTGWILDSIP